MLRGTRILANQEAENYIDTIDTLRKLARQQGLKEVIIPSIWESGTFLQKLGPEKESQMWTFKDKGDRDCCLIPEVTGIIQELWNNEWGPTGNIKNTEASIFYVSRCYRYERPQAGRYREFTQFGVEFLGHNNQNALYAEHTLRDMLNAVLPSHVWEMHTNVKRGLEYYVADGFEATCQNLGAQKQIAGGGRYREGIGFAIGIDRVLMAQLLG